MSAARAAILTALRAARPRTDTDPREVVARRIDAPARHTRPAMSGDPVLRLMDRLERRAATTESLSRMHDLPGAVVRYLARHNLSSRVACAPALATLVWPAEISLHTGAARRDEQVSVTPCLAGVAETGSLVLVSGAASPTTLNFVPEHHLVVLMRAHVVAHFEDAWSRLRCHAAANGLPRAVNVISGPSRTADIEQTIALGAHGPRRLHVFIVGESDASFSTGGTP